LNRAFALLLLCLVLLGSIPLSNASVLGMRDPVAGDSGDPWERTPGVPTRGFLNGTRIMGERPDVITGPVAVASEPPGGLPASFSWDGRFGGSNYMTPIKTQGCGDCWAFAPIGAMEAQYQVNRIPRLPAATGIDLSEQNSLSCTGCDPVAHPTPPLDCTGQGGCGGNYLSDALNFLKNTGTPDESCDPYTAGDPYTPPAKGGSPCGIGRCSDYLARTWRIADWSEISIDTTNIKTYLEVQGPVIVWMYVYANFPWMDANFWQSHFYSHAAAACDRPDGACGHFVVIVGWHDDPSNSANNYWIVRNSWGTSGGDVNSGYGGYFYETQDLTTGFFAKGPGYQEAVVITGVIRPPRSLDLGDLVVWRPGTGTWYSRHQSSLWGSQSNGQWQWGTSGDVPLIGDFDHDGMGDAIIWRASNGYWYVLQSSKAYLSSQAFTVQWGKSGDIPLVGDVDGDGRADLIVWRPSNGYWYVLKSTTGYSKPLAWMKQYGKSGDKPFLGDVDGDGVSDLIVWRPSNGYWYVLQSSKAYLSSQAFTVQWGKSGDIPLVGLYGEWGKGRVDLIVWRPSNGYWYGLMAVNSYSKSKPWIVQWGKSGDIPLAAGYDGDNWYDLAVWRPSNGYWYVLKSDTTPNYDRSQALKVQWGKSGDTPLVGQWEGGFHFVII
jgi:hypothetical protein